MSPRFVLFYRHFDQYSGGQQKVYDYFSHLQSDSRFDVRISFSSDSVWDNTNPWYPEFLNHTVRFEPTKYDLLFLAGVDWSRYRKAGVQCDIPVINLIQHVRHGTPGENVYPYLSERAIRICVSQAVEDAIVATNQVNGFVTTIENGIDIPDYTVEKTTDIFIAGMKNHAVTRALSREFEQLGRTVVDQTAVLGRQEFLLQLAQSRIAVLLPHKTEGFFLPALEAMKLSEVTIVPDCVGNRGFCLDEARHPGNGNCLMPDYDIGSLVSAVEHAFELLDNPAELDMLKHNARTSVESHALSRERDQFLDLMSHIDELW